MAYRSEKRFRQSRRPGSSQRRQKRIFYGLLVTSSAVVALVMLTF